MESSYLIFYSFDFGCFASVFVNYLPYFEENVRRLGHVLSPADLVLIYGIDPETSVLTEGHLPAPIAKQKYENIAIPPEFIDPNIQLTFDYPVAKVF